MRSSDCGQIVQGEGPLEEVRCYAYLGCVINHRDGAGKDVWTRVGKGGTSFIQLSAIWRSRDLYVETRIRLFDTDVRSVSLFGAEAWRTAGLTIEKM